MKVKFNPKFLMYGVLGLFPLTILIGYFQMSAKEETITHFTPVDKKTTPQKDLILDESVVEAQQLENASIQNFDEQVAVLQKTTTRQWRNCMTQEIQTAALSVNDEMTKEEKSKEQVVGKRMKEVLQAIANNTTAGKPLCQGQLDNLHRAMFLSALLTENQDIAPIGYFPPDKEEMKAGVKLEPRLVVTALDNLTGVPLDSLIANRRNVANKLHQQLHKGADASSGMTDEEGRVQR